MISQQNKGGGQAGLADRKGGAAGHSRFLCTICGVQAPSLVSMQVNQRAVALCSLGNALACRPGRLAILCLCSPVVVARIGSVRLQGAWRVLEFRECIRTCVFRFR